MNINETKALSVSEAVVKIVASFAGREQATVEEVLELAQRLPNAFAKPSGITVAPQQTANTDTRWSKPAVAIEQSVSDDLVTCLCCGKSFTMLKRHLKAEHGLTEDDYRARFGLSEDHPLVAPNYSLRKAEHAKRIGLGKYARDDMPEENVLPSA